MDFGGVVVGLGNPGNQYAGTRHNCGFAFVESLLDHARREGGQVQSQNGGKFSCELWRLRYDGLPGDWLAAMPQTFMNLSGQCVQPLLAWHKVSPDRLLAAHDELDIPPGELRFKLGGGNAGHNGLKSIISCLGSDQFPRVKIGVGAKPHPDYDLADWALSTVSKTEWPDYQEAMSHAGDAALCIVKNGCEKAAAEYNGKMF